MSTTSTTFKPGEGRKKGSLNKKTVALREFVALVVTGDQDKFLTELATLKGDKYISAYLMMLEYCTPKLARIEVKAQVEKRTVQVIEIDGTKIPI